MSIRKDLDGGRQTNSLRMRQIVPQVKSKNKYILRHGSIRGTTRGDCSICKVCRIQWRRTPPQIKIKITFIRCRGTTLSIWR
ncbi:hypothetical protein M3J09_012561 [Ascochyta lentis]